MSFSEHIKLMSVSQRSVFHPMYPPSVPTEKQEVITRKEPVTQLISQPLPEIDFMADKTDDKDMNLEDKNLDTSYSELSVYANMDKPNQLSSKEESDGHYVEVDLREDRHSRSLNHQLDSSGDYIESDKTTGASSGLDMHQELIATARRSGTCISDGYIECNSEDETDSSHITVSSQTFEETGGSPVDLDKFKENTDVNENETYEQTTGNDFSEPQDTQAVVFEFGDGSDLQPSFEIDPYLLTATSRRPDYLFTHEDRKIGGGTMGNLDYVFSGDKYFDTSQIIDSDGTDFFDLYNDTTHESNKTVFNECRSSDSFPYLPYSSDVRSTLSFLTSSSSSRDTSGISIGSGYISSESSHYFDSHLSKMVNFVPPNLPFAFCLEEEIPIYTY